MSALLEDLAAGTGASERTLRRAIAAGTIRATRPSPQTLDLDAGERAYVRSHWPRLVTLRRALRTEPNVEAAVLFGSVARGDDIARSDLDLLVWLREPTVRARRDLRERLSEATGRTVEVVAAGDAAAQPGLLEAVLRDGRVLVDRSDRWPALVARSASIHRRAARERRTRATQAAATLAAFERETTRT